MKLEDLQQWVREHEPDLKARDVRSLLVFGSVARGEARSDSDVDLMVEFAGPTTLTGFGELTRFLESNLPVPVDLTTVGGLHPFIRDSVLEEAIRLA